MENKAIEEIINLRKEFLSSVEVAAVLDIAPCTFRKKAEEYAEFFPIQRVGRKYRIPKAPFVAYVRTGKSFRPDPDRTDKQNSKALNEFAVEFEKKCRQGYIVDDKQTFAQYADYVIRMKERIGVKHKTIESYRKLMPRINNAIGHFKIQDIRPQQLNLFYEQLSKSGMREQEARAVSKVDLKKIIREKKMSFKSVAQNGGVAENTVAQACHDKRILESKAKGIAAALKMPVTKLFIITRDKSPLSNKTILEYHRLINTIFNQADKEMIIPYNPASKASPPKQKRGAVNYYEKETIDQLIDNLENEHIKWRTMVHLLIVTGARRGEIMGLKWDVIDWTKCQIHIELNVLYAADIGTYEDTTKTEFSNRYVKLPPETMQILKEYRRWYLEQRNSYGDRWHDTNFLFFQEKSGNEGMPMNPDAINSFLDRFSERYDLPHLNPHAFRHTMASLLHFNHVDSVSISHRLGHSKTSTTTDLYSHIMKDADEISADTLSNILFKKKADSNNKIENAG